MKANIGKCFVHHGEEGQNLVYLVTDIGDEIKRFYRGTVLGVGRTPGIALNSLISYERVHTESEEIEESDFTQIYLHVLGKLASKVNATISK